MSKFDSSRINLPSGITPKNAPILPKKNTPKPAEAKKPNSSETPKYKAPKTKHPPYFNPIDSKKHFKTWLEMDLSLLEQRFSEFQTPNSKAKANESR